MAHYGLLQNNVEEMCVFFEKLEKNYFESKKKPALNREIGLFSAVSKLAQIETPATNPVLYF